MIQATLSDSNYSDAESLLEWDDERAAEFAAAEKNKKKMNLVSLVNLFMFMALKLLCYDISRRIGRINH
jgi:hypothetical protein